MNVNPSTKTILLYGDSYVFGKVPGGTRFNAAERFSGVAQRELGNEYDIIEEGLRGRTLAGENTFFPFRNGAEQFGPILGSHWPLDLVILFLGTNDANSGSNKSVAEIVAGYSSYIEQINWWSHHFDFSKPKIMIVAPPFINEPASYSAFKNIFKNSAEKIQQFPGLLQDFAVQNNLEFFDSSTVVTASEIDGIHLDASANEQLGKALAQKINELIG